MKNSFFIYIFLSSFFCLTTTYGQDERFFRNFFGKDAMDKSAKENIPLKFQATSPVYWFDLNGDGRDEGIVIEKRESDDWINIHNDKGEKISSFHLEQLGIDSHLVKINVRSLSQRKDATKVLILHFYEGLVGYLNIKSTSRVFFLTIDNKDLKTLSLYKGPVVWDEASKKNHYHQRLYETFLFDYNNDGVKEVAVKHQFITRIYFYLGKGNWGTI